MSGNARRTAHPGLTSFFFPPPTRPTSLRLFGPGWVYWTSAWKPLICWPSFVVALMTMIGETYRTISISLTSWSSVPSLSRLALDQRTALADPVPRRGVLVGHDGEGGVLPVRAGPSAENRPWAIDVGLGDPGRAVHLATEQGAPARSRA